MKKMKTLSMQLWLGLMILLFACGQADPAPANETEGPTSEPMDAAATISVTLPSQSEATIEGLVEFPEPDRTHDPEFRYEATPLPPAGGVHHPVWVNCGVYSEPLPVELAIHSLEHGAVWITYQPELDAAAITTLQNLAKGQTHILVSPYPDLKSPIVLTAWARQLEVESADDPRIAQFIETFLHGTQSPEPGVTCAQGTGTPLILQ